MRITLDGAVALYDGEQCVAQHVLQPAAQGWVTVPDHHAGLLADTLAVERRPLAVYEEVAGDMEPSALLERMKMEHLLAQLDGLCEHAAQGDLDYKGFLTPSRKNRLATVNIKGDSYRLREKKKAGLLGRKPQPPAELEEEEVGAEA
jgi:hypothetical protein